MGSSSSRPRRRAGPPGATPAAGRESLRASRAGRRRIGLIVATGAALIAFTAGAVTGAGHTDGRGEVVERFGQAWEAEDYAEMHGLLDPAARERTPLAEFAAMYRQASITGTLATLQTGAPRTSGEGAMTLPVTLRTRIFGVLRRELRVPVRERDGDTVVDWRPHMVFPGLSEGETLRRETTMPPRAAILARDETPLAAGEPRITALGASAAQAIGVLGPPPAERAREVAARGLPAGAPVGLSGLEEALEGRLAGRPGGRLFTGTRVAASTKPRRGRDIRTTIDPRLQSAAVEALAGRFGGAVALDPANGEVLAFAGAAAGAPQPPGSVFKIITLAAALEHGIATPAQRFPVETATTLSGVRLENANGESCGGTLRESFAHSCNSVFAPLGVRVGAGRLVAMAERFGFNRPPALPGEQPSTIPAAGELGDDLGVGSTAIGQGRLLATTVQMASVAATIAVDGVRHVPTLVLDERGARRRVLRPRIARTVASHMAAVVATGTGTAAAIPGVEVAGKTGTAELRSSVPDPASTDAPGVNDPTDTDAWFAAFAPRRYPEVAVAVLLVGQGTGGATAAPAARVLLQAGVRPG